MPARKVLDENGNQVNVVKKKKKMVKQVVEPSSSSTEGENTTTQDVIITKPKVIKKKAAAKPRSCSKKMNEDQRAFLQACAEMEKIEKKTEKLHAEGHTCIHIYETFPATLHWCKKKQCVMRESPAAAE